MNQVKTYRYKLKPTKMQEQQFEQWVGACRYVYNLCLEYRQVLWQQHKQSISKAALKKELAVIAKETPWLQALKAQTLQAVVDRLDNAFISFYKGVKGYPKFARKGQHYSFEYWQNVKIDQQKGAIQLPKIGLVGMHYSRPCTGVIKQAHVKKLVDGWYVTVVVEEDVMPLPVLTTSIGIDVGIKSLITTSDGESIANPKHLKQHEHKLRRLHRSVSRKKKGSANRKKELRKLARQHQKVANTRKDFHHKLTMRLIRENQTIVVENLNIAGLVKNHSLAKSISDAGWYQFISQLEYKANWYGRELVKVPAPYTSKTCSSCGYINKNLTLNDRAWQCPTCGVTHDRDVNAAINIKNKAVGLTVSA